MARADKKPGRRQRRGAQRVAPRRAVNWVGVLRSVAAIAVFGAAVSLLAWKWDELSYWPVRMVAVNGPMQNVKEQDIRDGLLPFMDVGLVSLPLAEVRAALRQLAWVDDVRVSRVWPDGLAVEVVEQQPTARWGKQGLLNYRGEVFTPESVGSYQELTSLYGPKGSEQEVMASYLALNKVLAQRGMQLRALRKDERGSWRAELDNGVVLDFGRRDLAGRIKRFIAVYDQQLALYEDNIAAVDLRYHNGLAVSWKVPLEQLSDTQDG
jgi:cell division protein FtsQ